MAGKRQPKEKGLGTHFYTKTQFMLWNGTQGNESSSVSFSMPCQIKVVTIIVKLSESYTQWMQQFGVQEEGGSRTQTETKTEIETVIRQARRIIAKLLGGLCLRKSQCQITMYLLFNSTSTSRLGFKFGFRQSCTSSRGLSAVLSILFGFAPRMGISQRWARA